MTYKLNTNFKILGVETKNYSFVKILKSNIKDIEFETKRKYFIDFENKNYWTNIENMEINIKLALKENKKFYYNIKYTIEKGYLTDFASVPKIFRNIVSKSGTKILLPALIHDINYGFNFFTFNDSNKILKTMLKFNKMNFIKRNLVYLAVCTPIAKKHYKKHIKKTTDKVKIVVTVEKHEKRY